MLELAVDRGGDGARDLERAALGVVTLLLEQQQQARGRQDREGKGTGDHQGEQMAPHGNSHPR